MKSHYPGCMSDENCKCQDDDNENEAKSSGSRNLSGQVDEMIRSFDWETVHAIHCLTTASPQPLENLKSLARQMLMDVATSEKPITVMSNKFAAFIEPTDGNLMLEYNLARVEGLSSLANETSAGTDASGNTP